MSDASICPICGAGSRPYIQTNIDAGAYFRQGSGYSIAAGGRGRLTVRSCVRCGHGFTPLTIDQATLAAWYAQAPHDTAFISQRAARDRTAHALLRRIERIKPGHGTLLDVGCGPGLLVAAAQQRGWDATGIEPSAWARDWARQTLGLTLIAGGHDAMRQLPPQSRDVVSALDVIEHVLDPDQFVADCARVLKPGGLLVITTPKFDSLLARLMGRRWYCIFPAHLHYFTVLSLRTLLERSGFMVVADRAHVRHLGAQYLIRRMLDFARVFPLAPPRRERLTVPVCFGDEFEVYARIH